MFVGYRQAHCPRSRFSGDIWQTVGKRWASNGQTIEKAEGQGH